MRGTAGDAGDFKLRKKLAPGRSRAWGLLLGLCAFASLQVPPSGGKETGLQGGPPAPRRENGGPAPADTGEWPPDPYSCGVTFHVSQPGNFCAPAATPASPPASREDLRLLEASLEDAGRLLGSLQHTVAAEGGASTFQDIVSAALPEVRGANAAFHESLARFLRELEEHIQAGGHPHPEDEKEKLQEHLREMDHLLQATSRLADQLEQASWRLLLTLTKPPEKPPAPSDAGALQPPPA